MSPRALLYLHGFASSSQSSKGAYLAARCADAGLAFSAPDLNEPDFGTLTITRMVAQTCDRLAAAAGPVTLVGSSLGAIVAIFAALRQDAPRSSAIDSLVLMAPAVDLVPGLTAHFGPARLEEWERTNRLDVFHYADQQMRALEWGFFADARAYDPWAVALPVPTLVFQGSRDEVVEAAAVERWCARPNATLRMLEDGHQLLDSLDVMWDDMWRFLPQPEGVASRPRNR